MKPLNSLSPNYIYTIKWKKDHWSVKVINPKVGNAANGKGETIDEALKEALLILPNITKDGKKKNPYLRAYTIGVNRVFSNMNIHDRNNYMMCFGLRVNLFSTRMRNYKVNGVTCVDCGLKGIYFAVERNHASKSWHLNLYTHNEDGKEVMMTRDHIIPKSFRGSDSVENSQTMCKPCNEKKGNGLPIIKEGA